MPQITVNSVNIEQFGFNVTFDPYNKTITFDTAGLTTYNDVSGTGSLYVQGIGFSLIDQEGVNLLEIDWNNPQIQPALGQTEYALDVSSIGIDFFFQSYKFYGSIKDGDGQVYSTTPVIKKICEPVGITSGGYVDGTFQVLANCPDNVLTVKEVTGFTYANLAPESTSKTGVLYYPTGTVSSVSFSSTPFTNNVIYNGQYRVTCTTTAVYNLGDDVFVNVTYYTNNTFDLTCANRLQDIICCIVDLQNTKDKNCNTALGQRAAQQLAEIEIPFLVAISKEISGQDASAQVAYIRKKLNCNCGGNSIIRNEYSPLNNEPNPIDPTVTTIIIQGVGGTSVAAPTVVGNTKTFNVKSNIYQVVKGNISDEGIRIITDTATANTVKYKIYLNYPAIASNILTAIQNDSTLLTQFNGLIDITNFTIDISSVDGKCILNISDNSYFLSYKSPSKFGYFDSVVINGTTYTPPSPISLTTLSLVVDYLNGLGLGTFTASFNSSSAGFYYNFLSEGNTNDVNSINFTISTPTPFTVNVPFQKTSKSLTAFLQALVDYLCSLSAMEVALGENLSITYTNYNGEQVTVNLSSSQSQALFNSTIASVISASQALNLSFVNGINSAAGQVKLGGNLIENTQLLLNSYILSIAKDNNHVVQFQELLTSILHRDGSELADNMLLSTFNKDVIAIRGTTNGDYAGGTGAYLANSLFRMMPGSHFVEMGVYAPFSETGGAEPSFDQDKTATFFANEGIAQIFAKTIDIGGGMPGVIRFNSVTEIKNLTTTERDALDPFVLYPGIVIFNTTVLKHQGYDGTTWNNMY